MTLATAFGFNQDTIRTRSFEYGGHAFKVKVPLTAETDAMFERMKQVDQTLADQFYSDMANPFISNREKFENDDDVKFEDDDVIVKGYSLRETAKNKTLTQKRIVELFRLLVPLEKEFDMSSVDYAQIDEIFPFAIQMELADEIAKVISPNYTETRKK
jgi:hypothetical protein